MPVRPQPSARVNACQPSSSPPTNPPRSAGFTVATGATLSVGTNVSVLIEPKFTVNGTMNFATFSELAFQFRITPKMFLEGILFAVFMGAFGGLFPAMMAARRPIVQSLRA